MTLFLLPHAFPFGSGEQFLETEIGYLADAFDRVVIIPQCDEGPRRTLPANCRVVRRYARRRADIAWRLATLATRVPLSEMFWREIGAEWAEPGWLTRCRRAMIRADDAIICRDVLTAEIAAGGVDASQTTFYSYWLSAPALGVALLRRQLDVGPTVSRAHGYDVYAERHAPPYQPFQSETIAGLDRVAVVSDHGRAYLARRYPALTERVVTARLGVLRHHEPAGPSAPGSLRVVSCSALIPLKQVDKVVVGLGRFAQGRPDLKIDWVHFGDGPLRDAIERQARETLPGNVRPEFRGHVSNETVLRFYAETPVDFFVSCSSAEGVPVSMMEAQSYGIVVVGTAVGGVPEIVDDSAGALISPDDDGAEFAAALTRCLASPAHYAELRRGSAASWSRRYDADANYPAFIEELLLAETR